LDRQLFEGYLAAVAAHLDHDVRASSAHHAPRDFETHVREVLKTLAPPGVEIDFAPHPHVFPDVVIGRFGIEVKVTNKDSWRSVANSVLESTRDEGVTDVYVLFGKMGGLPAVRWGRYEDCVMHVRTSHVPRFELEMFPERSLFGVMGISYDEFRIKSITDKMAHVRSYARSRLKPGERLWWLEDDPNERSLPANVRPYMGLEQTEKRRLRAEAALLCPQIVKSSRSKGKYNDAVIYLLTVHGVYCPQARDLFSAGSVALRADSTRGGNYIQRALSDIEVEMKEAAKSLDDALFVEYWSLSVEPADRIGEWLRRADSMAVGWKPSEVLFRS
jgi:hypothetical protein